MKKELLFEKTPRCSMRGALDFAAWLVQEPLKCRSLAITQGFSAPKERIYAPMQLVAPSAVTIAVATDAIFYVAKKVIMYLQTK